MLQICSMLVTDNVFCFGRSPVGIWMCLCYQVLVVTLLSLMIGGKNITNCFMACQNKHTSSFFLLLESRTYLQVCGNSRQDGLVGQV